MSDALRPLIIERASVEEIRAKAREEGMRSLRGLPEGVRAGEGVSGQQRESDVERHGMI